MPHRLYFAREAYCHVFAAGFVLRGAYGLGALRPPHTVRRVPRPLVVALWRGSTCAWAAYPSCATPGRFFVLDLERRAPDAAAGRSPARAPATRAARRATTAPQRAVARDAVSASRRHQRRARAARRQPPAAAPARYASGSSSTGVSSTSKTTTPSSSCSSGTAAGELGAVDQHDERLGERDQQHQCRARSTAAAAARERRYAAPRRRSRSRGHARQQHRVQAVVDHVRLARQVHRQGVRADHRQPGGLNGSRSARPALAASMAKTLATHSQRPVAAAAPPSPRSVASGAAGRRSQPAGSKRGRATKVTSEVPMPSTTSAGSGGRVA